MAENWLNTLSWVSLALGGACALIVAAHELKHPQKMWIMNLVWPLTALYASVAALWAYFVIGTRMARDRNRPAGVAAPEPSNRNVPTWSQVSLSNTHCGAGCVLGDIVGENLVFWAGLSFWGETLYADYAITIILAWLFGIAFQYFAIKPMKQLSTGDALVKSAQADTLSILFFQIGMYGWMAIMYFILFPQPHLHPDSATFWFMMQIGMVLGFATAYPVNAWLLRREIKEPMG